MYEVHQCQFPQLSKLHILFTKPEASGKSAIWETEMGSEDKAGEYLNWNIYSDLSSYSIHICPLNILLQLEINVYEAKTEESEGLAVAMSCLLQNFRGNKF